MTLARVIVLLPLLGAVGACDEQLLNPMAEQQPRERAYHQSQFFDDGLAMHAPPDGTVPRERLAHLAANRAVATGIAAFTGELAPNGERLVSYASRIPIPVTHELLALGRKRYDITCGTCHGPQGDGQSIVGSQMALRKPPSLHDYANRPPGYIFEVATRGFGLMASYAAELTVEERWAVVAYIRALQLARVPADRLTPEQRGEVERAAQRPDKGEGEGEGEGAP